ncbi:DNA topoisomerase III [Gilliamella sp. HK2]|jgi:DNA topoisomerase III|uniref:DNA topoisomerase 3 n=1 Tax=unclassified Gilliamella TaxID=2685620 RepID=UPI00080EE1DF|nr:DNA topoisomerase 3 [Gilliamella apicola]OCG28967.1 DNA topoisomerase III [Gilliamella apicola]OCG31435.1 DNA topoisomerase III [Gilliamella apicola]
MTRLFIAEKPTVAKAIADVLGVTDKKHGYLICGQDNLVTWCFGHMLESAEPDYYLSDDIPKNSNGIKVWREEDLPIIPRDWIKIPKSECEEQLKIIGYLIKKSSVIVHAGDPDREGQLLVDEVLKYFNNQLPVLRYWVNANDTTSVKRGLETLKDNIEYANYGIAASARDKADWLIGMNLSRAFTLKAQKGGARVLLTVGRVQTPTLAIVVKRDRDIENFKPISHYSIDAKLNYDNRNFIASWKMKEEQLGLDEELRLIDEAKVNDVITNIKNKKGIVKNFTKTPKKKYHPTAFSLSALTLVASNKFGYSGLDVLNSCQSLYEKHKLTSYPRTDSCYLPESQFNDAIDILSVLGKINPHYRTIIEQADHKIKSKTWNDSKTTAHHGIIPTLHHGDPSKLSQMEKNIYDLIVRSYISQFYPIHEYMRTSIDIDIAGELFVVSGNVVTINGWKEVYQEYETNEKTEEQSLPELNVNDSIVCSELIKKSLKTKAPQYFTDGTLINAMSNIHRYVDDPEHKKILKEEDGLGTEATRATIVSELVRRGFIKEDGKKLISTKLGRELIDALPNSVKNPVLTAIYERMLKGIEKNTFNVTDFLSKQENFIKEQVLNAKEGILKVGNIPKVSKIHKCDCCGKGLSRLPGKKAGSFYWRCSGFPECTKIYFDNKGRPKQ